MYMATQRIGSLWGESLKEERDRARAGALMGDLEEKDQVLLNLFNDKLQEERRKWNKRSSTGSVIWEDGDSSSSDPDEEILKIKLQALTLNRLKDHLMHLEKM